MRIRRRCRLTLGQPENVHRRCGPAREAGWAIGRDAVEKQDDARREKRSQVLVRASRVAIALGVVVIGLGAALPFRQEPTPQSLIKVAPLRPALPLRRPDAPLELALPSETSPARELSPPPSELTGQRPSIEQVAPSFGEQLSVAPPPAMPIAFRPITDSLKPTNWKPAPPPQTPAPKPRKYILRDGDSLERLADRFLGDAGRADEIFVLNRHVLSRADLLPVGAEILLPPKQVQEGS